MSVSPETIHKTPEKRRFLEDSEFVRYYLWKYRKWLGIGLFALFIVNAIEVLPPYFLKEAVDITVERRPLSLLLGLAAAYLGVSVIQGLCRYAWRMYLIRASIYAGRDLREKYADHLFHLSMSFFDRRRMGDLMSLATNDVDAVRVAIGTGLLVFADALFYLITIPVAMFFLSPTLMMLACLPMPFVLVIVMRNEKKIHERFEEVQHCFSRISALVQEDLNGIRVVKAFAQEDTQVKRIDELGKRYVDLNLSLSRAQSVVGPCMDFVMSIGMLLLLVVGGWLIIEQKETAITVGTFVAFQRYIQKMVWPMAALGMALNYFQRALSSSGRLKKIFETLSDTPEKIHTLAPFHKCGRIEFKNLTFQFPQGVVPVLKNIDLTIEKGERVAFVGRIGSGKSALLSLIPRLYPVQSGMLRVDGIDVNDWILEELRNQVGYVSQEVFLFGDSISENVGFGLPLTTVVQAAELATIHEEISQFQQNYQTRLGERGINLSGGQKQRLTLARALAKSPNILILDDALSSVDVQTEARIMSALSRRENRKTEIIAAHRISTVQDADRIFVLDQGGIVQAGKHSELIQERNGLYRRFYDDQKHVEEVEIYQNELIQSQ